METNTLVRALVAGIVLTYTGAAGAAGDADLIASATAAAPAGVGEKATVIAFDENMQVRTLREGSNGFTCLPDNPASPGQDPMCLDENGMAWANAWMSHEDPPKGKIGLGYMLMGGSDASNTDPFAAKPAGSEWVDTGPHIMILNAADLSEDPTQQDRPDTSAPYVMWGGTPYAHLMLPVK